MKEKLLLGCLLLLLFALSGAVASYREFYNPALDSFVEKASEQKPFELSFEEAPPFTAKVGYTFYHDQNLLALWNDTYTTYWFDVNSGIQWTENPPDSNSPDRGFWTKNIFCVGYYSGGVWNKIKCADELTNWNMKQETDNENYVWARWWKDFTYAGYDMRLAVRYDLNSQQAGDYDGVWNLGVNIYGKNIDDDDIPYDLGFRWKVTRIHIADDYGDAIDLNGSTYFVDQSGTRVFDGLQRCLYNQADEWVCRETPEYKLYDYNLMQQRRPSYIYVNWKPGLGYRVTIDSNGEPESASVSLDINAGKFVAGQEKHTTIFWEDPLAWYLDPDGDVSVEYGASCGDGVFDCHDQGGEGSGWYPGGSFHFGEGVYGETPPDHTNVFGLADLNSQVGLVRRVRVVIAANIDETYVGGLDINTNVQINGGWQALDTEHDVAYVQEGDYYLGDWYDGNWSREEINSANIRNTNWHIPEAEPDGCCLYLPQMYLEVDYVGCGATISQDATLKSDVTGCTGDGLVFGASDITLDCNNHVVASDGASAANEDGIVIGAYDYVKIKDCNVSQFYNNITSSWGTDANIWNNNIERGLYTGINFNNAWGSYIFDNNIVKNGMGIYLQAFSYDVNISHNEITFNENDGIGISSKLATRTRIFDNNISQNSAAGAAGIFIGSSDNNISNNSIKDNGFYGIQISGMGKDSNFYNNVVVGNYSTLGARVGVFVKSDISGIFYFFDNSVFGQLRNYDINSVGVIFSIIGEKDLNAEALYFDVNSTDSDVRVGWWVDVNVADSSTIAPISGADLNITDRHGKTWWENLETGSAGNIGSHTYWVWDYNQTSAGKQYYSPYDINVFASGYSPDTNGMTLHIDENKTVTIWFGAAAGIDFSVSMPTTCTEGKGATSGTNCDRIWFSFDANAEGFPIFIFDVNADGQAIDLGFFNITNNGSNPIDIKLSLGAAPPAGLSTEADTDTNPAGSTTINTDLQTIVAALASDANQMIWVWGTADNYNDPENLTISRNLDINANE